MWRVWCHWWCLWVVCGAVADVDLNVDWPTYLSRHDGVWSFAWGHLATSTLPTWWSDAPFVGNGMLGAYITISPEEIRLQVSRADLWDHQAGQPYATNNDDWDQARVGSGYFVMDVPGQPVEGWMRMILHNATIVGGITTSDGFPDVTFMLYVHAERPLVVLQSWPPRAINLTFVAEKIHGAVGRKPHTPYHANPDPTCDLDNGTVSTCQQKLLAGGTFGTAWMRQVSSSGEDVLAWTCANDVPNGKPAGFDAVERAREVIATVPTDFEELAKTHSQLESFYYIQLYKLGSATRCMGPDNCWAYDLLGPWFSETTWPDYHFDLNVQLAHWPVTPSNHPELGLSLIWFIERNVDMLIKAVPPEYRNDSACLGTVTGFDMQVENGSSCQIDGFCQPPTMIGDLTWLMHNMWLQYRMTMNVTLAKDLILPLLSRTLNYYSRLMTLGSDGKYHLPPTDSPEYGVAPDCTYELALFRWGFATAVRLCKLLKDPCAQLPLWRERHDKLVDYHTDEDGLLIGEGVKLAHMHRHYSHLFPIFPLRLWTMDDHAEVMVKSLDWWSHFHPPNGFSLTGMASMSGIVGRYEAGINNLTRFFSSHNLNAATMYWEENHYGCNESPLSAAYTLQTMLLESWGDLLHLFPTLPPSWSNAAFYNMRAEGAFLVSANMTNGTLLWVHVHSEAGEPLVVKAPRLGSPVHAFPASVPVAPAANGTLSIDLGAGESVLLWGGSSLTPPKAMFSPLTGYGAPNQWGKHDMPCTTCATVQPCDDATLFEAVGTPGSQLLRAKNRTNTDVCLAVKEGTVTVMGLPCASVTDPLSVQWDIVGNATAEGHVVSRLTDTCLSVFGGVVKPGKTVNMDQCAAGSHVLRGNQYWFLTENGALASFREPKMCLALG